MRALILILFAFSTASAKMDDSVGIFFPKELKYLLATQEDFPVFWWNFVVVEPRAGQADFAKAEEVCRTLAAQPAPTVQRLVCGDEIGRFAGLLKEWADDLVLREPFDARTAPAKHGILGESLNELSFIGSAQKDLLDLKRHDPFDEWKVFLDKSRSLTPPAFRRERGFMLDPVSQRLVIPVLFGVAPKMVNVAPVAQALAPYEGVYLIGAHGASYRNESQVHEDMNIVSAVGLAVLVLFIGFLVIKGRLAALMLFPPVAVAVGGAAWLTEMAYGSIHGLTLAFGSGIVGLAVDYGMHGAFNAPSKQTWKSNMVGFLTTMVGLVVLCMSGIPLIQQMMVFASLGLIFGFVIFFALCKALPKLFSMAPIKLTFPNFRGSGAVTLVLIAIAIAGAFTVKFNFDLRKMNYLWKGESEATNWFFSQGADREVFLRLHEGLEAGAEMKKEADWAKAHAVIYNGLGEYLPPENIQRENLASWKSQGCAYYQKALTPSEHKVFAPFVQNICADHALLGPADLQSREYLSPLINRAKPQSISIFSVASPEAKRELAEVFPEARSLTESVQGFSRSLESDLRWMIPVVFFLSFAILFVYYRNFVRAVAAFIPFFTGLGLFYAIGWLRGDTLDLISVLGLLMVFGFSVDYGVFVTDIYAFPEGDENEAIVFSVLSLAALTNIIGFFPMVFAKHPVLHQLGFALFFGTIGTYLGSQWGIASFLKRFDRRRETHE